MPLFVNEEVEALKARVKELEARRDGIHAHIRATENQFFECSKQLDAANADRARLRGALQAMHDYVHGNRSLISAEGLIRAALTPTDASQWLRERERAVAERVATALGLVPEPMSGGRIYAPHMVTDQGKAARDILDALLGGGE